MLKFSVGYQYNEDRPFADVICDYADRIETVYFPWVDMASGRSMLGGFDGYFDYGLQEALVEDLTRIRDLGIRLKLLFNANCYGEDAMSKVLEGRVCSILDYLGQKDLFPHAVTTTSPAIAHMIREHYQDIELTASVNMKIGSVKGMQYVAHLFDNYCVAKECNRDIPRLQAMKQWAVENGKKITILANSGCMRDCSGQIFHDNMVAHEAEISKQKNIQFLPYMCYTYLKDHKNFVSVLQNTWIRPEDLHNYEGLVDTIKLATRAHQLPGMVIGAYVRGMYSGNLLDLFEPSYSPAFAPFVIDSSRIPDDFWQHTTQCNKDCTKCNYCKSVLQDAKVLAF